MCLFLNRCNPEMELHYLSSWKAPYTSSSAAHLTILALTMSAHTWDIAQVHTPRKTERRWVRVSLDGLSQIKEQSRGSVVFFLLLLLLGCHLVVKRSNPSQPERNHLAPTLNRHFPVLNSLYSGSKKKDNIQQIRQIPVFQSTLRNSHKWQWDWQVEEVPGLQLLYVAFPSARVQR